MVTWFLLFIDAIVLIYDITSGINYIVEPLSKALELKLKMWSLKFSSRRHRDNELGAIADEEAHKQTNFDILDQYTQ